MHELGSASLAFHHDRRGARRTRPAGSGGRPPRAALLLARPGARHLVKPAAGGKVPSVRSLESAVSGKGAGKVRVVCQGKGGWKSLARVSASRSARRASTATGSGRASRSRTSAASEARKLLRQNRALARKCKYKEIQPAVNASGNNDRVVVMPGRYTEPTSRSAAAQRPALRQPHPDRLGRRQDAELPLPGHLPQRPEPGLRAGPRGARRHRRPSPPLTNRQGIPDLGPLRALQPPARGQRREAHRRDRRRRVRLRVGKSPEARPRTLHKHVVIRADRADGFVAHNLTARGALEHGIYIEETDGYRIDTVKMFWAADYGNLTFTSDHGLYTNCDGFGAGDAVLYPGAAPETGEQADKSFYPDAPRINTTVQQAATCAAACSPTRARWATPCASPTTTSTATPPASRPTRSRRPATPASRPTASQVDHNYIYSNNLDLFKPNPPVEPVVGILPSGVGIFWAGHNNGRVHDNWIWDNWRNARLPALDPRLPRDARGQRQPGRARATDPTLSTSCGNRFYRQPARPRAEGLPPFHGAVQVRQQRGADQRGRAQRRGLLVGRGRHRHRSSATAGTTTSAPTARPPA